MSKKGSNLNKGAKIYVQAALSAASNPLRKKIIKYMKEGASTTLDLVEKTNENRYIHRCNRSNSGSNGVGRYRLVEAIYSIYRNAH